MRIEDEKSRQFYANECVKSNWSVRQLKRQIGSFYYERLLASQDIEAVEKEIGLPEKVESKNIIRVPYVLEFSGLEGKTSFYEKDLEQAIIDHLQKFLLELGRGFSFVSRQQKITFDGRHFFIDLVFYNYILKCFVIIDLNNIKDINDSHGHEEGDTVIKKAASTLIVNQEPNTDIIRTDGNEFLVYMVGYSEKDVISYTRKIYKELKELPYGYGAAIGYSMIMDDIKTVDDAINEATIDMRNKKENNNG